MKKNIFTDYSDHNFQLYLKDITRCVSFTADEEKELVTKAQAGNWAFHLPEGEYAANKARRERARQLKEKGLSALLSALNQDLASSAA